MSVSKCYDTEGLLRSFQYVLPKVQTYMLPVEVQKKHGELPHSAPTTKIVS